MCFESFTPSATLNSWQPWILIKSVILHKKKELGSSAALSPYHIGEKSSASPRKQVNKPDPGMEPDSAITTKKETYWDIHWPSPRNFQKLRFSSWITSKYYDAQANPIHLFRTITWHIRILMSFIWKNRQSTKTVANNF